MTTTPTTNNPARRRHRHINRLRVTLLTLFAALVLAACGTADDDTTDAASEEATETTIESGATGTDADTTGTDTATAADTAEETDAQETDTEQPNFGVGQAAIDSHVEWIVGVLNGEQAADDPATQEQAAQRFSPTFLAQVPASAVLAQVTQLQATVSDTWTVVESTDFAENGRSVTLDIGQADQPWELAIMVDGDGLIEGAQISPSPDVAEAVSYDQVVEDAQVHGPVSMLVAEIIDGTCDVIYDSGADTVTPIGSTFKLYVLAAVADTVANGDLNWDDPLPIRDELKSLPSGSYQNLDAGTERTVMEHAQAMIGASDNTATDHLIDLVGRDAVEAQLDALGNSVAERNRPFLTTRELFILKLQLDETKRADYLTLNTEDRRTFLDEMEPLTVTVTDAVNWSDPINVEELEWFATPLDQCRALTVLTSLTTDGSSEVRDILSTNAPVDPTEFPYAAFKGGSEPGVLNLAALVERPDGRRFAMVGNITNPDAAVNETAASATLASALQLIADE